MNRKFFFAVLLMLASPVFSEPRHASGSGEKIDFGLDVEGNSVILYLAEKDSNEPLDGLIPKIIFDDDFELEFIATKQSGVYFVEKPKFDSKKISDGELVVYVGDEPEMLEIVFSSSDGHGHAEVETYSWFKNIPFALVGFLLFFIGILVGTMFPQDLFFFDKKPPFKTGTLLLGLGMLSYCEISKAGPGHNHGHIEVSGGTDGSVKMSKKSQFLLNLKTRKASQGENYNTLKTIGHVSPDTRKLAVVVAPRDGFLVNVKGGLIGKKVSKGEVLAQLESIGLVSLRAPIGGTVMNMKMISGSRVSAGTELVKIVDSSTAWIDAEIFQEDLPKIAKFKKAYISVPGGSKIYEAKLVGSTPEVNESTLSGKVYLHIENSESKIPMGSLVEIAIETQEQETITGISMPRRAVLNKTDSERFVPKQVHFVAGTKPDEVIITQGIEDGDLIVTNGNYQLLIGSK